MLFTTINTVPRRAAMVAVAVAALGAGGVGVAAAATPTAPAATPGVNCTYTISDPNGADVHDFPAHASNLYGPTRAYGQQVTSRRSCAYPPYRNGNTVSNDGVDWVQVIVGTPGNNVNGWMGLNQLSNVPS